MWASRCWWRGCAGPREYAASRSHRSSRRTCPTTRPSPPALACGLEPHTDMNPILLKPESEMGSQVIVQGRRLTTVRAREYSALKPKLMAPVLESFERLKSAVDLVIVEGAGSPAEVNLRPRDIANMGFARAANVPVVLAGDIDRGGVIAQIVGTQAGIDPADAGMIARFVVNKIR